MVKRPDCSNCGTESGAKDYFRDLPKFCSNCGFALPPNKLSEEMQRGYDETLKKAREIMAENKSRKNCGGILNQY
jgi:hypothetical protein